MLSNLYLYYTKDHPGNELIRLVCAWRIFLSPPTDFLSQVLIEFRITDGRDSPASLQAKMDGRQILSYNSTKEIY